MDDSAVNEHPSNKEHVCPRSIQRWRAMSRLVNPGFFADAYLVTIALAAHVGMFPWMYGMSESVAATPR